MQSVNGTWRSFDKLFVALILAMYVAVGILMWAANTVQKERQAATGRRVVLESQPAVRRVPPPAPVAKVQ